MPLHSPSSLECEEVKTYNEKMQFVHTLIQDIYRSKTSTIEFLHICKRGWSSSEQARPITTLMDPIYIEELVEDEGVE